MIPIFILNWNGIEDTIECMESVLKLDHDHYLIVLIDNGSDNNEGSQLKQEYSSKDNVKYIQFEQNLGFCNAHIEAFSILKSEMENFNYIALLNNDTVIDPFWLSELEMLADNTGAGIIASKMIQYYDRERMDNAGHWMLNTGEILPLGHDQPVSKYNEIKQTIGACGGGCLYRSAMIDDIGFFDSRFTTGYEDAEFGLRAIMSGYTSYYCPTAIVYHKMGNSISKIFNLEYSIMIHSSILYSYFKNVPLSNIILAIPSFIIKYVAMFGINTLLRRKRYKTVMYKSIIKTWKSRREIRQKRKAHFKKRKQSLSFMAARYHITWFLPFDMKRFWRLIVNNKKGGIDSYNTKN